MSVKNYTQDGEDRLLIDVCQQELADLIQLLSINAAPLIKNFKIGSVKIKNFYANGDQPKSPTKAQTATERDQNNTHNDYPSPNHYADTARWIHKMKSTRDFVREANQNIAELARILTAIFGWVVDENQLRKALNRI